MVHHDQYWSSAWCTRLILVMGYKAFTATTTAIWIFIVAFTFLFVKTVAAYWELAVTSTHIFASLSSFSEPFLITHVGRRHFFITVMTRYVPGTVLERGGRKGGCFWCIPDLFSWWKFVWFTNVNSQTGLRLESVVTLITLKSCTSNGWFLVGYNLLLHSSRIEFLLQKLFPALCIPSQGGWADPLLGFCAWRRKLPSGPFNS